MAIPVTVRAVGGPFDVVFKVGSTSMGFITRSPAPVRQVTNVAPRIRTGGDAAYSSEAFEQIVLHGFFSGGDRRILQSGDTRYQWTDGGVALHMEEVITLAASWDSVDTSQTATARQIIDFNPAAYTPRIIFGAGTHLRTYNTSSDTWESAQTGAGTPFTGSVVHLFANDLYVFISLGASQDAVRWDGAGVNSGFTVLTGFKANAFGWYKEVLYRALGYNIYAASNNNGSAWGSAIPVGLEGTTITDLYEAANLLIIAKPEGLYSYDGSDVEKMLDFKDVVSTTNGAYGCEFHGSVYFPEINTVQKMAVISNRPSSVTDITPRMMGDTNKERYGHGQPKRMFATPHKILVAFDDGEGLYPELLAYNEIGWHQLYRGTSGETLYAAGFSRLMDWILINVDGATYRQRVINSGDTPYPSYAATGEVYSPAMDAGYPDEPKAWRSVSFPVEGCDADNTITVKYRIDRGSWTTAGVISLTPDNPDEFVEIPIGSLEQQETGKRLEIDWILTRDPADVTSTPKIKLPIVVRTLPAPKAFDAYSEQLILDPTAHLRNGYGAVGGSSAKDAGYTVAAMLNFLDLIRDNPATIRYYDEWGRKRYVKITDARRDSLRKSDGSLNREGLLYGLSMYDLSFGAVKEDRAPLEIGTITYAYQQIVAADYQGLDVQWLGASYLE